MTDHDITGIDADIDELRAELHRFKAEARDRLDAMDVLLASGTNRKTNTAKKPLANMTVEQVLKHVLANTSFSSSPRKEQYITQLLGAAEQDFLDLVCSRRNRSLIIEGMFRVNDTLARPFPQGIVEFSCRKLRQAMDDTQAVGEHVQGIKGDAEDE